MDRKIEALGGRAPAAKKRPGRKPSKGAAKRGARRMPKNVKPLVEYVKDVLAGAKAGLRVKDVEAAVRKAGYKTFSKEFYGQVAVALREGPFKKVSRGVCEALAEQLRAGTLGLPADPTGRQPTAADLPGILDEVLDALAGLSMLIGP